MRSKHRNIALLSALVTLALGVSASAASAAIKYEWKVNGSALATGASKEYTLKKKAGNPVYMTLYIPGGKLALEVGAFRVKTASPHKIVGGKPGTLEATLELENIQFSTKYPLYHESCHVTPKTVVTESLTAELVEAVEHIETEGKSEYRGTNIPELLMHPVHGEHWFSLEFKGECPTLTGAPYEVNGLKYVLGVTPSLAEAKIGDLSLEANHRYYQTSGKIVGESSDLAMGREDHIGFNGEAELELVSKEVFGAF
jgi:hypothetical protein